MKINIKVQLISLILFLLILFNFSFSSVTAVTIGDFEKGNAYELTPIVKISYDKSVANDLLLPVDQSKSIPIFMNFSVSGTYDDEMMPYLEDEGVFVDLKIVEKPDYCTATISPKKTTFYIKKGGATYNASLALSINERGHALSVGTIKIQVDVNGIGSINNATITDEIQFIPGYLPLLELDTKQSKKKVVAGEIADFEVNIKNRGNAISDISFMVVDKPEGWKVQLPDDLEVDLESNVTISARGPKTFGFHNDRGIIKVKVIPSHYKNESLEGKDYFLSFIVQSEGFSTPGFGSFTLLLGLLAVISIFRYRKKIKFKTVRKEGEE
ncbi:MAG: hypothetical protein V5A64_00875 [Candidatus Thermoplasmatota archaeon]